VSRGGALVIVAALVARAALAAPAPARANAPGGELRIELGTTAVASNNVLPLPLGLGVGVLAERGLFGLEVAGHADVATICDNTSGGDGRCGALLILDAAPRLTPLADRRFSPYANVRFQLTHSRRHSVVFAAGPRLGVRFRGARFGAYLEAGPSFVSAEDGAFGRFVSNSRWFPQASIGMTYTFQ
jgi:hypothetical protein